MLCVYFWSVHSPRRLCMGVTGSNQFTQLQHFHLNCEAYPCVFRAFSASSALALSNVGSGRGQAVAGGNFQVLSWTHLWGNGLPGQERVALGHTSAIPDPCYHHLPLLWPMCQGTFCEVKVCGIIIVITGNILKLYQWEKYEINEEYSH